MRTIGQIRAIASDLLEDSGYVNVFPLPVDKLIEQQGYQLRGINKKNAPTDFSGQVDHEDKLVVINNSHSNGRKRFTAAHELGHIMLHPNENKIDYRICFSDSTPKEIEANRFAAEILMPYGIFQDIFEKCAGNFVAIAEFFGVSTGAATIRAEVLGLSRG